MKILLDTNIVLDILLAREPFVEEAKEIFLLIENHKIEGFICATTMTTIHYLIGRQKDKASADGLVLNLLKLFEVALVDKQILQDASLNNGVDYEDAVIYTSAKYAEIDIIITRDKRGFKNSDISILKPKEFLAFFRTIK
ncbi:MAG: PIN domain-containing protein [Sulfurovum sp.]|nr:PIN domain-containing protein [Sulfurovum sp.]